MRALLLAAGRGSRMRPLTDVTPKPLLTANGARLMDWSLVALKAAGITEVVINTAHRAECFEPLPQELARAGFQVTLSREGEALETRGGIVKALSLLTDGTEPFLVLAGDVVHDVDLTRLTRWRDAIVRGDTDGHLIAVPNPDFHPQGDMTVLEDGRIVPGPGPHTYGCLMILSPRLFEGTPAGYAKLFPWLWDAARAGRVTAEVWEGFWANVGTPADLAALAADTARAETVLSRLNEGGSTGGTL